MRYIIQSQCHFSAVTGRDPRHLPGHIILFKGNPKPFTMVVDPSAKFTALLERFDVSPGIPVPSPTKSYWQTPPHRLASHQSSSLPDRTTVAIIGSGITGASVAHHLLTLNQDLDITVLEARELTSGATGRNGGHIKENPMLDYLELKEIFGMEAAKRIVKFRMAHLDVLVKRASELDGNLPEERKCLARVVDGVDAFFDEKKWEWAKARLAPFMEDLPEERERWKLYDAGEAQEVSWPGLRGSESASTC